MTESNGADSQIVFQLLVFYFYFTNKNIRFPPRKGSKAAAPREPRLSIERKAFTFESHNSPHKHLRVILNAECARHVKDLFCEAKFTLNKYPKERIHTIMTQPHFI